MSNWKDLARRIQLGEDSELELKSILLTGQRVSAPRRNDLGDELAAFANSRGGVLVLGVDDQSHEVIGIPLSGLDAVETWVREICYDSVRPPLAPQIRRVELPGADGSLVPVLGIEVSRSLFVHKSPGGYFHRVGSSKREMPPEYLARLMQERSQSRVIRYDETPVPHTAPSDLDDTLTRRFLRLGADLSETNMRKLRVVAEDENGVPRLTIAGTLLCSKSPSTWLPHAEIQAVSYAGERSDVNYQEDARDIGGPLDTQVFDALHFVRRNARLSGTKTTARSERPQFSERAVFEALVNAVAHRDYSMAGARIRLHMFKDRLELFVPGGLANTLTPESMELRQYSRNELIVSLLARCPVGEEGNIGRSRLMDRRGDGVPIILQESLDLSGRRPEYIVIDDSELRLIIWAAAELNHRDGEAGGLSYGDQ
ncbi:MAG: transcriptional regulator [Planctomycetota bacterium]|nr:MAG: transcriptional regulator [Planctomycetota bacterium]